MFYCNFLHVMRFHAFSLQQLTSVFTKTLEIHTALPTYSECMFGVTRYNENDSDDEHDQNGPNFAPRYVSYALVDSKHQQSGEFQRLEILINIPELLNEQ